MTLYLVCHGAWSAAWAWKKMRAPLADAGHTLITPTYTGLGERGHLASPAIDLETHIADMLGVIETEDLADIVLIGHSYGGMVATGVADRAAPRLRQIVYLDAFVPADGQCLFDLLPAAMSQRMRDLAKSEGEGWRVPPNPPPPDTDPADLAWIAPRRRPQPIKTFSTALRLRGNAAGLPRRYIYCTRPAPGDVFRQFADRAQREPGWRYGTIDASHNPHITAPAALAALLQE